MEKNYVVWHDNLGLAIEGLLASIWNSLERGVEVTIDDSFWKLYE